METTHDIIHVSKIYLNVLVYHKIIYHLYKKCIPNKKNMIYDKYLNDTLI